MRSPILLQTAAVISASLLLFACHKEFKPAPVVSEQTVLTKAKKPQTHQLKGRLDVTNTSYAGTLNNHTGTFYPGTATGNFTLLGNTVAYMNMFVTGSGHNLTGIATPIQPYFDEQIHSLGIDVLPPNVAILLSDKQGNTIWGLSRVIDLPAVFINDSVFTISGNPPIVGGTGKYKEATGGFTITSYFNVNDLSTSYIEVTDGTITYPSGE